MRNTTLYTAVIACSILAACNGTSTSTTSSDSTAMQPGDSSVTTTTTTTVVHHPYAGTFAPKPNTQYFDLQTRKKVNVKIDSERGEVVNSETNEPIQLLVEPVTHDTIYGATGNVVNNYIINDSGNYRVDTVRINTVQTVEAPSGPAMDKSKYKSDDEKMKQKGTKVKVRER